MSQSRRRVLKGSWQKDDRPVGRAGRRRRWPATVQSCQRWILPRYGQMSTALPDHRPCRMIAESAAPALARPHPAAMAVNRAVPSHWLVNRGHFGTNGLLDWPRSLAGNPDSPQAVVFLTSIIDELVSIATYYVHYHVIADWNTSVLRSTKPGKWLSGQTSRPRAASAELLWP